MENTFDAIALIEKKITRDYIYLVVALVDMLTGLVLIEPENVFLMRLGIFMLFTGFIFATLLLLQINDAAKRYNQWHDTLLSKFRNDNGLPLLPHEANNIQLQNEIETPRPQSREHIVYLDKVNNEGQHETDLRRYNEKNRPPREFILACHRIAVSNDKRRVTERAVIALLKIHPEWERWNVFLDEMEKVGILIVEDDREHAARRWDFDRFQLDHALEVFEYDPTLSPTGLAGSENSS